MNISTTTRITLNADEVKDAIAQYIAGHGFTIDGAELEFNDDEFPETITVVMNEDNESSLNPKVIAGSNSSAQASSSSQEQWAEKPQESLLSTQKIARDSDVSDNAEGLSTTHENPVINDVETRLLNEDTVSDGVEKKLKEKAVFDPFALNIQTKPNVKTVEDSKQISTQFTKPNPLRPIRRNARRPIFG